MAYDGNGTYELPAPAYPAIPNTTILAEDFNEILSDLKAALSSVLVRDGQAAMIGDLNMGGFGIAQIKELIAHADGLTVSGPVTLSSSVKGTTAAASSNDTSIATTAFVTAAILAQVLAASFPGQAGNGGKLPITDGSTVTWSGDLKTNVIRFVDSLDITKRAGFDLSGIATGTSITLTVPTTSTQLIGEEDAFAFSLYF